ncbi:TPA: hypothetical protein ACGQ50_000861 [Enterobacter cloacae]
MSMKAFLPESQNGKFQTGELNKPTFSAFATPAAQPLLESAKAERKQREEEAAQHLEQLTADNERLTGENTALLESVAQKDAQIASFSGRQLPADPEERLSQLLCEAAASSERAEAAAAVLDWASSGDASAEAFDEMALVLAGIDDTTDELSDEQIDNYNDQLVMLAEAAVGLGADAGDVTTMIDENDSDSAQAVMDAISVSDEDEAIASYSVGGGEDGALMESALLEASIKVVRGGVVKIVRKRPHKIRISGAQKAALKKARLKAHTATAKIARAKSLKIRKKRGL